MPTELAALHPWRRPRRGRLAPAGAERSQEHFRCTDGSRLLADFSADRRDLRLRWNESATVIALSAPAPNLTFVGEDMNILFREDRAFVAQVNAPKRSCRRVD